MLGLLDERWSLARALLNGRRCNCERKSSLRV